MNWNSLKIFLAIADSGSLAGAARALEINHSTVFRRLNSFETEIGGRLFERTAQGYALTSMGDELLVLAQHIAHCFDDLERRIVGKDFQPRGLVRITAPNNIAYRFLPAYLADFNRLYPEIKVEILVSNQEFNMSSRQADIALRVTAAPPEHLVGRQLAAIKWGVYAASDNQDCSALPENLAALHQHALIGAGGGMRGLPAFTWLEHNLAAQISTRCDDLVSMSYLAEAKQGLALLPDDQQRPGIQRLFEFPPGQTSNLWLLTHADLRHVTRFKLVMQHLAKAFAQDERL